MNDHDFEEQLKRQKLRRIPSDWKRHILGGLSCAPEPTGQHHFHWRELFWPSPFAWGAVAVVWFGIFGLNVAMRDAGNRPSPAPADYAQLRSAIEQKRRLQADIEEASVQTMRESLKPRSDARAKFTSA